MTTTKTAPVTVPVLTPAGSRIPVVGTLAFHEALGFCTVVSRTQRTLCITVDDIDGADDVVLNAGKKNESIISRAVWLERVSEASLNSACIEVAGLEARLADAEDAFHGATTFVKEQCATIEARIRDVNEMIVSIDAAEACGWEFDEYATYTPKKNFKKTKAPKPVVARAPVVVELEDDTRPEWLVAELNACYGDNWVPNAQA